MSPPFTFIDTDVSIAYFLSNLQAFRANNSRIKNVTFSEYCFYMNTNIKGDFQI